MKTRTSSFWILFLFSLFSIAQPAPAAPKVCDGIKTAQVANFSRQIFALQNLRELETTRYQKAEINYTNNLVLGNSSGAQLAKIDMQSAQGNINNYNSQINQIDQKRQAILKTCTLPNSGSSSSSTKSKLAKCSTTTINALNNLASQYRAQQNSKKLNYEYMQRSKVLVAQYQSLGQLSNSAMASIDYSKYLRSYQQDDVYATLIKREFDGLQSSCSGSGVTLPPDFVPPAEQSSSTNTNTSPACQGANCLPSSWNNSSQAVAGTNGQPSRVTNSYAGDLSTYCINRGTGTMQVTNPRIFMAFTATDSWNKDYLSTPDESDFFKVQSDIGRTNTALETVDLSKNWIHFGSEAPKTAQVKKLSGITVLKLTTHICDARFAWQSNLRSKFSPNIKGVGFFYIAETGVDRPLVIYLNGFNADWFEDPKIEMKASNDENILEYSGTTFSVSAYQNTQVTTGFPTFTSFGSICFKIDGDASKFPCSKVFRNGPISGNLSLESLSSGAHTLEIYIPGTTPSRTTSFTYNFTLQRPSKAQQDEVAKAKIERLIATCNANFLGGVPINIRAINGMTMSLNSYSWGSFDWKQDSLARLKIGELASLDTRYIYIPLNMNWVNTSNISDLAGALVTTISTGTWGYNDTTSGRLGGAGWRHPIWMNGWQPSSTRVWTVSVPISECGKKAEYVDFHTQ